MDVDAELAIVTSPIVGTFYLTRFKPIMTDSLRKLAKRHRPSKLRAALEQLITKESA